MKIKTLGRKEDVPDKDIGGKARNLRYTPKWSLRFPCLGTAALKQWPEEHRRSQARRRGKLFTELCHSCSQHRRTRAMRKDSLQCYTQYSTVHSVLQCSSMRNLMSKMLPGSAMARLYHSTKTSSHTKGLHLELILHCEAQLRSRVKDKGKKHSMLFCKEELIAV